MLFLLRMVVRLGEHDMSRTDEVDSTVDLRVAQKVRHERYVPGRVAHDIMILVLEEDAPIKGYCSIDRYSKPHRSLYL